MGQDLSARDISKPSSHGLVIFFILKPKNKVKSVRKRGPDKLACCSVLRDIVPFLSGPQVNDDGFEVPAAELLDFAIERSLDDVQSPRIWQVRPNHVNNFRALLDHRDLTDVRSLGQLVDDEAKT